MPTTVTSTIKSSGGDYTSLSAWEAAKQGDLVTLDQIQQAECYAFQDTTAFTINGWTTDATRYIRIFAAAGAEAKMPYNTSTSYRLEPATGTADVIRVQEDFVRIERIQLTVIKSGANAARFGINYGPGGTLGAAVPYLEGCVIRGQITAGSGGGSFGIKCSDNSPVYRCSNTVVYDFNDATNIGIGYPTDITSGLAYWHNNTVVNCTTGYRGVPTNGQAGSRVTNCLYDSQGLAGADGFGNTFHSGSNYNCSDLAADAPGANSRNSQTTTYVDEAGDDFHLASGDVSCKDFGTDLSADASYPITVDFDWVTRTGTWDIGADEFVAAAASMPIFPTPMAHLLVR